MADSKNTKYFFIVKTCDRILQSKYGINIDQGKKAIGVSRRGNTC